MTALTVCVCGGGIMGSAYITVLRDLGERLRIYNRTKQRVAHFAETGARVCETAAEAASGADVIISAVSDDDAAREVWFADTGLLAGARRGAVAVEMSTLSMPHINDWIERVTAAGLLPLDCPVTGSRTGAAGGTLYAFAGGSDDAFERAWPVLGRFCSSVHRFTTPGDAMRFKLVYNLLGAGVGAMFAEAVALAEHVGFDPLEFTSVIKEVGWGSAVARSKGDAMARRHHDDVHYRMALFHKDIEYALAMASGAECTFAGSRAVADIYARAAAGDLGRKDISAVREAILLR